MAIDVKANCDDPRWKDGYLKKERRYHAKRHRQLSSMDKSELIALLLDEGWRLRLTEALLDIAIDKAKQNIAEIKDLTAKTADQAARIVAQDETERAATTALQRVRWQAAMSDITLQARTRDVDRAQRQAQQARDQIDLFAQRNAADIRARECRRRAREWELKCRAAVAELEGWKMGYEQGQMAARRQRARARSHERSPIVRPPNVAPSPSTSELQSAMPRNPDSIVPPVTLQDGAVVEGLSNITSLIFGNTERVDNPEATKVPNPIDVTTSPQLVGLPRHSPSPGSVSVPLLPRTPERRIHPPAQDISPETAGSESDLITPQNVHTSNPYIFSPSPMPQARLPGISRSQRRSAPTSSDPENKF